MPRTYGRLHAHLVWSTKHRALSIRPEWQDRLYGYVGGIIRRLDGTLFVIGGIADHVHLYLECPATIAMSDLVSRIKSNTSRWIHMEFSDCQEFQWQRGYGVFSVDPKHDENLRSYILNQAAHHQRITFVEEYTAILRSFSIEPDGESFD